MIQLTLRKIATAVSTAPSVMKNAIVLVRLVIRMGKASLLEWRLPGTGYRLVWSLGRTATEAPTKNRTLPNNRRVRTERNLNIDSVARNERFFFDDRRQERCICDVRASRS